MNTEADFKAIPRLRWKLDKDHSVIATTNSRRNSNDHLYFQGPCCLGLYYERKTQQAATWACKTWQKRLGKAVVKTLDGDFDGTIIFRLDRPGDIPEEFLIGKARGSLSGLVPTEKPNSQETQ